MKKNFTNQGFSLVEVLVSISILVFIMSTVLFNYSTFNDRLALGAALQEIAIVTRQAQTYGLTVKESAVGGGNFNYAYGVYFDYNTEPSSYYLFIDTNANGKYDVGSGCRSGSTECVEKFTLRNNITITSICDKDNNCPPGTARKLEITFLRPNPDATILFSDSSGVTQAVSSLTGKLRLTSNKGNTGTLTIESTGQISIQ